MERPEPAAYLANRNAALGMFRHSLHDRAGDPAAEAGASSDAVAWMHLRSAQPDSHDRNRQVHVDGQISSVLVGVGRRFEVGGTGELQAGAMLGHGRARNDSRSQLTGYTARGVVTGTSVGAYATWLQDAQMRGGAYVDGWLQYGRFRNSVRAMACRRRYDARNWSASAEAGYVLPLRQTAQRGVYLQPQLQVVHSRYDSDRLIEANGTVVEDRGGGETSTPRPASLQPWVEPGAGPGAPVRGGELVVRRQWRRLGDGRRAPAAAVAARHLRSQGRCTGGSVRWLARLG